jgi:hypothetical protein
MTVSGMSKSFVKDDYLGSFSAALLIITETVMSRPP